MKKKNFFKEYKKLHFVGIGGVSMSGLAKYCLDRGISVSGSDRNKSDAMLELANRGARVYLGHSAVDMGVPDAVIYTSALSDENPEIKKAKTLGIPLIKRSELLGKIAERCKTSVAVSGSHGKTTCTAMIAHILTCAGVEPTAFIGGEDLEFGNYKKGKKNYCVLEACEYKKNFFDISPSIAVVLNVDNDHPDTFNGIVDTVNAFGEFIGDSLAVINADDEYSKKLFNGATVTFGCKEKAVYMAKSLKEKDGCYSFDVYKYGNRLIRIKLSVKGAHNVYNALAAFTVADILNIDKRDIKRGLEGFYGVKRRAEQIGEIFGATAICDYAHHPNEIRAVLNTFNGYSEDVLVVFQPHTYSRTLALKSEFVEVLKNCKNLVVYKTFAAREEYLSEGSHESLYLELVKRVKNCIKCDGESELSRIFAEEKKKYKTVLFLGAGDIYDLAKKIVKKM